MVVQNWTLEVSTGQKWFAWVRELAVILSRTDWMNRNAHHQIECTVAVKADKYAQRQSYARWRSCRTAKLADGQYEVKAKRKAIMNTAKHIKLVNKTGEFWISWNHYGIRFERSWLVKSAYQELDVSTICMLNQVGERARTKICSMTASASAEICWVLKGEYLAMPQLDRGTLDGRLRSMANASEGEIKGFSSARYARRRNILDSSVLLG